MTYFQQERELLLGGDIVRMDGYENRILVHGVVAPDRSRALFAMAITDSIAPDPAVRLRFRGLEPDARYRIQPVIVGTEPSGLIAPPWWGPDRTGRIMTGAALDQAGVACPRIHPDQVILYRADRA